MIFDGVPPASIGALEGVEVVRSGDSSVKLLVTGPMDGLVKALAGSRVLTINSAPPELEDVFLSYYGERDGS